MNELEIIKNALYYNQTIILTHKTDYKEPAIIVKSYSDLSLYDIDYSQYDVSVNNPSVTYLQSILPSENIIRVGSLGELISLGRNQNRVIIRNRNLARTFFFRDRDKINITFTDEHDRENLHKAVTEYNKGKRIFVNGLEVKRIEGNYTAGDSSITFYLYNGKKIESFYSAITDIAVKDEYRKEIIFEKEIKNKLPSTTIILIKDDICYEVFGEVNKDDVSVNLLNKKTLDIVNVTYDELNDYEITIIL